MAQFLIAVTCFRHLPTLRTALASTMAVTEMTAQQKDDSSVTLGVSALYRFDDGPKVDSDDTKARIFGIYSIFHDPSESTTG